MQGTRIFDKTDKDIKPSEVNPGDYWKNDSGSWSCCCPNGLWGNLSNYQVIEHENGTITVSPSILVQTGQPD